MTNDTPQIIALVTAIIAAVVTAIATTISVLNYLRERPRVCVELELNIDRSSVVGDFTLSGEVRCFNIGRRPVFIKNVHAGLPNRQGALTISIPVDERHLEVGGPPLICRLIVSNVDVEEVDKCRAWAIDSADKTYRSGKPTGRRQLDLSHLSNS